MSPNASSHGSVRSSAVINAEIRALWLRSGGRLTVGQEAVYRRLVVEWAAAVRAERDVLDDAA